MTKINLPEPTNWVILEDGLKLDMLPDTMTELLLCTDIGNVFSATWDPESRKLWVLGLDPRPGCGKIQEVEYGNSEPEETRYQGIAAIALAKPESWKDNTFEIDY